MENTTKKIIFDAKENLSVKINISNIPTDIKGHDENDIICEFTLNHPSESYYLDIDYDTEKNQLSIDSNEDDPNIRKLNVLLPKKSQVEADIEFSKFTLSGLEGNQSIRNEHGNIKLSQITGNLNIDTENGGQKAVDILGNIKSNSENGGVSFLNVEGNININIENGGIKVESSKGETISIQGENGGISILKCDFENQVIECENGGIYTDISKNCQLCSVSNENGKITAVLEDDENLDLTAQNEIGRIKIGIEGDYESKITDSQKTILMIKGNRKPKIILKNENGSISILNSQKASNKQSSKSFNFDFDFNFDEQFGQNFKNNIPDFNELKNTIKNAINSIPKDEIKVNIKTIKDEILKQIHNAMSQKKHSTQAETNDKKNDNTQSNEPAKKVKIVMEKITETLDHAFDKIHEKVNSTTDEATKDEINSKSRLKILEMLQEGKITVEDAEKLLKAIGE